MACEYFVNGNWISENQFKELLNNGLIDNLIKDKKLDLKGFKVDSSKILEKKTREVETSSISAVKLASILAEEVKSRAGYPINMLSALELNVIKNPDGSINEEATDFKIPLWASPFASKFESLLTSVVTNKIIKQKLPGNSYVLGSEEGFKIKEGDETAGELKNSAIVFTDKFDAKKGLQPLRWDPEQKKMLPAQIMIPFKFRDESGKILDLKQFTIKGPDGRLILDMEKIPEKLLMLFGFRIPTQGQNSMAAVEIVGFLPETSGDLVLAPRDFTKQMGSDFDVDKLYTYMYSHYYLNGRMYTNFVSDTAKIEKLITSAKEQLNSIIKEYKLSKKERALIDKYIKEKEEANDKGEPISSELAKEVSVLIEEAMAVERGKDYPILEEFKEKINNAVNAISVLNRSYKAARQNKILDIHLKIMLSSNPDVISKIIALDSSGDFKKLSEEIYKARVEQGSIEPVITILSETYQRTKFTNATAGKSGVGYFSLDSTFNASAQGKDLVFQNLTEEDREELFGTFLEPRTPTAAEILEKNMPVATFGNFVSKGDLSNKYTLRSQEIINRAKLEKRALTKEEKESLKLKSIVIRSLQSAAVDNEKEQILDKLNISDETIPAIRALTLLGFEEQEIAGLLAQEIVWEFIENIKEAGSSLTPYDAAAQEKVFDALIKKYDPEQKYLELTPAALESLQAKSAEDLLDNIFLKNRELKVPETNVTPDFNLEQIALLQKFIRLTEVGQQINTVQSAINSESKGVPTSLIETSAKVDQISNLGSSNIFNANNLLGKTIASPTGKVLVADTINGFAALMGTMYADKIFRKYFPYKQGGFQNIVEEVTAHMAPKSTSSMSSQTELKKDIFKEIKSYLFANSGTNLFTGNPDLERRLLFIDSKDNMSLARKISMVQSQTWFQRNGFLNKLDFDLNKNGQPSRVNFEAATGENFDERNIYDGFIYLLDKNFVVGTFKVNGQDVQYTSRMLAQELVAAAFLEGGVQGAKQYLKYIPNSYLKTIGFGNHLSNVNFQFESTFFGNTDERGNFIYNMPSQFTKQFFQNNPERTKTVNLEMLEGKHGVTPANTFTLKKEYLESNFIGITDSQSGEPTVEQTKFLSIYDTKLPGKYALYEFDSVKRVYRRIPTLLGSYGFVQYNSEKGAAIPIESKNFTEGPTPEITAPGYEIKNIPTKPTKEFTPEVVNNIAPIMPTSSLELGNIKDGGVEALDDILNNLLDSNSISNVNRHLLETLRSLQLSSDFKLKINDKLLNPASFDNSSNTLSINIKHPKNANIDYLANLIAHELIHAHTSKSIYNYLYEDKKGLSAEQIATIEKLENLQKIYLENLVKEEGSERFELFKQLYINWKKAQNESLKNNTPEAKVAETAEYKKLTQFMQEGDLSKYYGALKLSEFVTMALTDQGFQERLNNIKDEQGISLWEKIKQAIADILNVLGLEIQPGSLLAQGIKDSMDLIAVNQEELKKNLIETKEFIEFGTKYKFEINSEGNVTKAEFAQGNYTVFKPMNKANAQKKYDNLKENKALEVTPGAVSISAIPSTDSKKIVEDLFTAAGGRKTSKGLLQVDGQHWYLDTGYWKIEFKTGRDELFFYPDNNTEIYIGDRPTGTKNFTIEKNIDTRSFTEIITQPTKRKTYSGKVTSLQPNQIFVFGSNPEGRHGAGAAKYAKDNFGAVYGQGEGLQGQSYALPTKDLRVKENNGLRSISPEDIIKNIQTLYEVAKQNPDKEFLISDYSGTNLNGYTADEMADMFIGAGYDVRLDESGEAYEGFYVPTNIIHNENFQKIIDSKGAISKEATSDFKKYEIFPGVFTNQGQTEAIDKMTNFLVGQDKTFLLKGRGGTGKTTIVKMIMDKSNIPHNSILGATISDEARGILAANLPASVKTRTIASALGLVPDFNSKTGELYFRERSIQEQKDFDARGKSDPIENARLIIIDEASMVGNDIYEILMRKKRPEAKVIFMGDNAQIPPIMPDGTSKDSPVFNLLEGTKNFSELTERMRQGEESPILPVTDVYAENIESMQRGEQGKENPLVSRISNFDLNTNSGVLFSNNRQEIIDGFVEDFRNDPDNLKNAVIIGARNEVVDNFAQLVRSELFNNPSEPFVIGDIIRVNSPFMQGKEVLYANGFKGKVVEVTSLGIDPLLNFEKFRLLIEHDTTNAAGQTVKTTSSMVTIDPANKKDFKSVLQNLARKAKNKEVPWPAYYAIKESIVDLGYNYAITAHKVQGSTYKNVYILEEDIMSFPGGRLQRNRMIYTAVSRPTTKLVVYSSKSTPIAKKGLDMGVFTEAGINPEALSQKPTEDTYYGEETTFRDEEKNTDYYDDYEAYRRMKNSEDDMIEESPLNSDAIRNYLLICGK